MDSSLRDQIKEKADIAEIARALGIKEATYDKNICCPFHDEKNPSFRFYRDGSFKCFTGCEGSKLYGSDVFSLVMHMERTDFKGAIAFLAKELSIITPQKKKIQDPHQEAISLANYFFNKNLKDSPAYAYLKERGITDDSIDEFGLGYARPGKALASYGRRLRQQLLDLSLIATDESLNDYDFFRNRVTIPIFNASGELAGFSCRSIDGSKPKYLNSAESVLFHKNKLLFNLNRVRNSVKSVFVVEGCFDVIGLWQAGFHNSVCAMGTSLSSDQIEALTGRFDEIFFMFDNDSAGKDAAWRVAKMLIPYVNSGTSFRFIMIHEDSDPFEISLLPDCKDRLSGMQRDSLYLSDFILEKVSDELNARRNLDVPEVKEKFIARVNELLSPAPNGVFREVMIYQLSKLLDVSIQTIVCADISCTDDAVLSEISRFLLDKYGNNGVRISMTNKTILVDR